MSRFPPRDDTLVMTLEGLDMAELSFSVSVSFRPTFEDLLNNLLILGRVHGWSESYMIKQMGEFVDRETSGREEEQ